MTRNAHTRQECKTEIEARTVGQRGADNSGLYWQSYRATHDGWVAEPVRDENGRKLYLRPNRNRIHRPDMSNR